MPESKGRILIVDDQERNRYVLCRVLERSGFICETASTGRDAMQLAQSHPDLIILDVNLPDISGYEVCSRLKHNPLTADILILQISATFVNSDATAKALEGGADSYLTHPIDSVVLTATVRAMLRLRRAEAASRIAASELQSGFDALAEGVVVTDTRGQITRFNRAFANICGNRCTPERDANALDILRTLLGVELDLTAVTENRQVSEYLVGKRSMELTIDKIGDELQHFGYIIVLTDVTDRKLAEYALRTAEQLAGSGRMAHAIAHEINNPLAAVVNLLYLAQHTVNTAEIKDYLKIASDELDRVSRITRQSLSFHRDTSTPVSVSVNMVVQEVIAMYRKIAVARSVEIQLEEEPTLSVRGFPGQLRQVFANLVRNAIEASPEGSRIRIRVGTYESSNGGGVNVFIHDCGSGLTDVVRDRMFDPFFTTKELKGSGLGLWVTKVLVAHHGGRIRFRSSNIRQGTSFAVFLPLRGYVPEAAVPRNTTVA